VWHDYQLALLWHLAKWMGFGAGEQVRKSSGVGIGGYDHGWRFTFRLDRYASIGRGGLACLLLVLLFVAVVVVFLPLFLSCYAFVFFYVLVCQEIESFVIDCFHCRVSIHTLSLSSLFW